MPKLTLSAQQIKEYIKRLAFSDESIAGQCCDIGEINVLPLPTPGGASWDAHLIGIEAPAVVQAAFNRAKRQAQEECDLLAAPYGGSATRPYW